MRAYLSQTILLSSLVFACGPSARPDLGGGGGGGGGEIDAPGTSSADGGIDPNCTPTGPENTPATCSDGIDNDCNGLTDCSDPSCSGIGTCPVCGSAENLIGQPFFLPDGIGEDPDTGEWPPCTTNAQCVGISYQGTAMPNCIQQGCHASYTSTLHYTSFIQGSTYQSGDIESICVNIEHSWLRDMQIEMIAPNGDILTLQKFLGQEGGLIFVGHPIPDDDDDPQVGMGSNYCWTPTATNPDMLDYVNNGGAMLTYTPTEGDGTQGSPSPELPPGNYSAASAWSGVNGSPLNGDWTIRVTDLWPIDNGHIFNWSITFKADLFDSCAPPIID